MHRVLCMKGLIWWILIYKIIIKSEEWCSRCCLNISKVTQSHANLKEPIMQNYEKTDTGEIVLCSRSYNCCDNYGFCPKTLLYGINNPQVVLIVSNRVINLIYSFIYTEHIRNYLIFILGWITQGCKRNVEGGNCSFICFHLFLPKTILIREEMLIRIGW